MKYVNLQSNIVNCSRLVIFFTIVSKSAFFKKLKVLHTKFSILTALILTMLYIKIPRLEMILELFNLKNALQFLTVLVSEGNVPDGELLRVVS